MSLVSKVLDAIDGTLEMWMDENKVFTVHDVKIEVRNQGFWLLHDPCRDYVKAKFENGELFGEYDYCRTSTLLNTGKHVQVFHPVGIDPTTHHNADKPQLSDNTSVSVAQAAPVVPYDSVVDVDVRHRIRIPASFTKRVGWNVGETVRVIEINGVIEITQYKLCPTHTVDCYGNIRIALQSCISNKYAISVDASKIIAKPF